jgi:hypothetical protein
MINLKNILYLLPFLLVMTTASGAEHPTNIVLILADDLGWADTRLYRKTSLYETPNLGRLAARGMTFTNAYASPICSPTRASMKMVAIITRPTIPTMYGRGTSCLIERRTARC